jgi:hypothetical protein
MKEEMINVLERKTGRIIISVGMDLNSGPIRIEKASETANGNSKFRHRAIGIIRKNERMVRLYLIRLNVSSDSY